MSIEKPAALVTASFARLDGDRLVERFYATLFESAPGVRSMFPQDMAMQRVKLRIMLTQMVRGLGDPTRLLTTLDDLGARHAAYGTLEEHFPVVGAALVSALSESDPEWDDEIAASWVAIYGVVVEAMVKGLRRGRAELAA